MEYQDVTPRSKEEAEFILSRGLSEELQSLPISIGLYSDDLEWAQAICAKLAEHSDEIIRGNAILAFGHLARRFGELDGFIVRPIISSALSDSSPFVQGQLDACKEDLQLFLGWLA
jgi:hypothetical protein